MFVWGKMGNDINTPHQVTESARNEQARHEGHQAMREAAVFTGWPEEVTQVPEAQHFGERPRRGGGDMLYVIKK